MGDVIFPSDGNSYAADSSGGVSTAGAIGAVVSVLSKGGADIAVEEDEDEAAGAPTCNGAAASISEVSGVAVGTVVEASSDETIGGPPLEGANLYPLTRVCAGVAAPPCSDPCLHLFQVQ